MFRKSPMLISVPLDGTDTVPGLARLQQRRRQDVLEERLGIPKGKPCSFLLNLDTRVKSNACFFQIDILLS